MSSTSASAIWDGRSEHNSLHFNRLFCRFCRRSEENLCSCSKKRVSKKESPFCCFYKWNHGGQSLVIGVWDLRLASKPVWSAAAAGLIGSVSVLLIRTGFWLPLDTRLITATASVSTPWVPAWMPLTTPSSNKWSVVSVVALFVSNYNKRHFDGNFNISFLFWH